MGLRLNASHFRNYMLGFFLVNDDWYKSYRFNFFLCTFQSQAISYEGGITYRSLTPISKMHVELERGKYDTMDKVFTYALKKNGPKKCLGTREVIDEEDEPQPNGRLFKKYILGDYLWKSYDEIDRLCMNLSRGLRELGLEPKARVCVFAETRAEWLIMAIAAFRQNLTRKNLIKVPFKLRHSFKKAKK